MDRIITTNTGGFPIVLDDIRFFEKCITDVLVGISSPVTNSNKDVILSGAQFSRSGGNISISEGFIVLAGEIIKVNAHTVLDDSKTYQYFDVSATWDPTGLKSFQTNISYQTYQIRVATLVQSDVLPAGKTNYTDLKTFVSSIETSLKSRIPSEKEILTQTVAVGETYSGTYTVYSKESFSGEKVLSGRRWVEDVAVDGVLMTLPIGYRPVRDRLYLVPVETSSKSISILIKTNGDVILKGWNGQTEDYTFVFSLDGLRI